MLGSSESQHPAEDTDAQVDDAVITTIAWLEGQSHVVCYHCMQSTFSCPGASP